METPNDSNGLERWIMWLGVGLALIAAASYVLMGLGILGAGDANGPPLIVYSAATCYAVGGLLILTRRRGLWIAGAAINGLLLVFWLEAYQGRPAVLFSAGGIASKTAQLLPEICLLYLLTRSWMRRPQAIRAAAAH